MFDSLLNSFGLIRPHPGPLPRERERRSAVVVEFGHAQLIVRPDAKWREAAVARVANELRRRAEAFSLSPGERAGVRAGVDSDPS